MPPKKGPAGPTPIEATTHQDTRTNIPTADAAPAYMPDALEAPIPLRYPRDTSLDPQLVWKGKDEQDAEDLVVTAPPIYIQEKVDPRVLVENLRRTAKAGAAEPELTLFESFDGLEDLEALDYYRHDANWSNRMILGDSLNVMASLAERERLRGKVQMIYLDPPYGIKFGSNWQVRASKRDVKDGKLEDASREVEQIKAFRDTWELGIHSYLAYLRDRLTVARELLTESGSVFVQIGDENVHLVRALLDEIFGAQNFVSQVTVAKTTGATADRLPGAVDYLVWFAKSLEQTKFRPVWRSGAERAGYTWLLLEDGTYRGMTAAEANSNSIPIGSRLYRPADLTSQSGGATTQFEVRIDEKTFRPGGGGWKTSERGMERLRRAGRLHLASNSLRYRRFADDFPVIAVNNLWTDTGTGNFTDDKLYVVQTGTRTVQRCMLMTTDPGDLVLDPTCGSGTTAFVGEQWGRRWITIDTSRVALALARQRLMGGKFPYYLLADSTDGRKKEESLTGQALPPVEPTNDIRHGFVYERVQHITLKSIANNPDIKEGMSREEIDAAIKRHADFELLYDKPYEDKSKVRVTGPFTVESLSPHRSLAFAPTDEPAAEKAAAIDPSGPAFEQSILDNLAKAGIQTGDKAGRIAFDAIEPHAGTAIHAIGIREGDEPGPKRVAISLGPQYGTVSSKMVKEALKEAAAIEGVDLIAVLAFAFDPAVSKDTGAGSDFATVTKQWDIGKVPILIVRMNADLVMGKDLAKTGNANLFTVFGEPDIELRETDEGLVVDLHGVDVYDPTTGEVRSKTTDQIALWMLDTDYDGESFFVRHCYFTGGNDPYKRLKTALKAEIDEDAWATLYQTTSRPFPPPQEGRRIAVKVINDYGDEVMKVLEPDCT